VFAAEARNTATRIGLLPQCALALAPELVAPLDLLEELDELEEVELEFDEPHAANPTASATVADTTHTRLDRIHISSRELIPR
jgi:hypothetical protein